MATDFKCNGLYNSIVTIIVEFQDVYEVYSTSQYAQTHIIPTNENLNAFHSYYFVGYNKTNHNSTSSIIKATF